MKEKSHDTLVRRLATMLFKLNQGESLAADELADEFGVNLRTIQRDLHQRFAYLPLQKIDGRYRIEPMFLGKLSARDIERFASFAGVRGMFPSFSDEFLRDIFDTRMQAAILVKGHHYEDLAGKEPTFKLIERMIVSRHKMSFRFKGDTGSKTYQDVELYKLLNLKGIWYLAGKDADKLKTFTFTKIESVMDSGGTFSPDPTVEQTLTDRESIWFSEQPIEAVIQVAPNVAGYFKRRKLIANQVVVKDLQDGGLIIAATVGHKHEVLPIVRYWIPHLRILSPEGLQQQLEAELKDYLDSKPSQ